MKRTKTLVLGAVAVTVAASSAGYWLGKTAQPAGQTAVATVATTAPGAQAEHKLLYYRNPMGLADTSPVPKKDPMGMDYVAVYKDEQTSEPALPGQISISSEKVQQLGVRTELAQLRALDRQVRAAGRIEPDESRVYAVAPKFEGYVERLYVNTTGQAVAKGQALFEVYSPELLSAQREYAIAAQGVQSLKDKNAGNEAQSGMQQLATASLARLKNWDVSAEQIKALSQSGTAKRTLTFRSPVTGVVTEKKVLQGMRVMPGDALYQVADLSAVWVVADVFEQDIGLIALGGKAKVSINAYPDKVFEGKVSYIYPTLNSETRTVPVRIELANPGRLLKPGMYAQVDLPVASKGKVLAVPISAVIDSGTRQIVLVQTKPGRFEPRQVKLGARSDSYVQLLDGVKEGEAVVVSANFLIDAESNLKAALAGFDAGKDAGKSPAQAVKIGHQATGSVTEIDLTAGTISISHGAIASLKWPAMTMEFVLANSALLKAVKPGDKVAFEFVERGQGEWVITALTPLSQSAAQ